MSTSEQIEWRVGGRRQSGCEHSADRVASSGVRPCPAPLCDALGRIPCSGPCVHLRRYIGRMLSFTSYVTSPPYTVFKLLVRALYSTSKTTCPSSSLDVSGLCQIAITLARGTVPSDVSQTCITRARVNLSQRNTGDCASVTSSYSSISEPILERARDGRTKQSIHRLTRPARHGLRSSAWRGNFGYDPVTSGARQSRASV